MNKKYLTHFKDTFSYLYEPEYAVSCIRQYWRFLLVTASTLVVFVSCFSVWQIAALMRAESDVPESPAGSLPFSREELEDVLENFNDRAARYEALEKNPPRISEPQR